MAVFLRLVWAGLRARMQYRWDFLLTNLAYAVITGVDFLTVAAVLHRFRAVAPL